MKHATPPSALMFEFSEYLATALKRKLPDDVMERAKIHLVDSIAAILSGSRLLPGKRALRYVRTLGSRAEAGVLGVLPGIVGSIQALETIKLLLGLGDSLSGRILAIDTLEMSFRTFKLRPDPSNAVTWENRDKIEVRDLDGLCAPWMSH